MIWPVDSMIVIERNQRILRLLALFSAALGAFFGLWWFLAPDQVWSVFGIDLSSRAMAMFCAGLAILLLVCLPLLCRFRGNVCLCREGIVVMNVLYRWSDIQSVSCHVSGLLPVCNITLNDGRQRLLPVFLLGDNFPVIQDMFEHPERRADLEACPSALHVKALRVRQHERRKPLVSFDAPTSRYFRPFVVTAGLGLLGLLIALADECIELGAKPLARAIGGSCGAVCIGLSVVFLRKWRTEKREQRNEGEKP